MGEYWKWKVKFSSQLVLPTRPILVQPITTQSGLFCLVAWTIARSSLLLLLQKSSWHLAACPGFLFAFRITPLVHTKSGNLSLRFILFKDTNSCMTTQYLQNLKWSHTIYSQCTTAVAILVECYFVLLTWYCTKLSNLWHLTVISTMHLKHVYMLSIWMLTHQPGLSRLCS